MSLKVNAPAYFGPPILITSDTRLPLLSGLNVSHLKCPKCCRVLTGSFYGISLESCPPFTL